MVTARSIRLAEIADQDLDVSTQRAIREQNDRDVRIQKQHEREEAARLERLLKQKEYNGELLNLHEQKQLPVAFELVLETDHRSNAIVIEVDLMLVQYMKQHQGREDQFRPRSFVCSQLKEFGFCGPKFSNRRNGLPPVSIR